ncbi:unnamed protein product, partial [Rotaria magnacalcarata]
VVMISIFGRDDFDFAPDDFNF